MFLFLVAVVEGMTLTTVLLDDGEVSLSGVDLSCMLYRCYSCFLNQPTNRLCELWTQRARCKSCFLSTVLRIYFLDDGQICVLFVSFCTNVSSDKARPNCVVLTNVLFQLCTALVNFVNLPPTLM